MSNCPPCDGSDPYKPGGSQSPGSPYCGDCSDPYYGPGFPAGGTGPTDSGCVEDTTDPCAVPELQDKACPNTICDDRFSGLATSKRLSIVGVVGRCLYRFASKLNGFVVSDDGGQHVTNRPCVKIPFLKNYVLDPETQQVLTDSNGAALESNPPSADSIIVADDCGCQNRYQGKRGTRQKLVWTGEYYEFEDDEVCDNELLVDLEGVEQIDYEAQETPPEVAVLIPDTKTVCDPCGGTQERDIYRIARTTIPLTNEEAIEEVGCLDSIYGGSEGELSRVSLDEGQVLVGNASGEACPTDLEFDQNIYTLEGTTPDNAIIELTFNHNLNTDDYIYTFIWTDFPKNDTRWWETFRDANTVRIKVIDGTIKDSGGDPLPHKFQAMAVASLL